MYCIMAEAVAEWNENVLCYIFVRWRYSKAYCLDRLDFQRVLGENKFLPPHRCQWGWYDQAYSYTGTRGAKTYLLILNNRDVSWLLAYRVPLWNIAIGILRNVGTISGLDIIRRMVRNTTRMLQMLSSVRREQIL